MNRDFRGKGLSLGNIFWFLQTRHISLSDNANCTVLRAVVLTQYWRVTDRRTDGIAIAGTALAMRALRRTVKTWVDRLDHGQKGEIQDGVQDGSHVIK